MLKDTILIFKNKLYLRIFWTTYFIIFLITQSIYATDITSYTYNKVGDNEYLFYPSPSPYNYETSIYAEDLGVESLYKITSLFVSDEYLFIASGGSIIVADHSFKTQHIISSFVLDGKEEVLTEIDGLWVTEKGELYACEPGKNRILHFNDDFSISRILGRPEGIVIAGNVAYQPLKVAVDSVGRIYVVANNIYEGIIELNTDGTFSRYFGKVSVKYTATQLFWRRLQTETQRAFSASWLPVNFSNITIEKDDFVYATVAGSEETEPIRKLNAKGVSILRYPSSTNEKPRGDLFYNRYGQNIPKGPSLLTAIDVNEYGVYIVLDSKRSRIFAYDDDGYMLYAFGEQGTAEGRFQNPVDIKYMGDKLLVVDRGNMSIEVYKLNDYGKSIYEASRLQYHSDYKEAAKEWEKVLDYNQNFQYAYVGIGKALYRDGDYKRAQDYFLRGQDVDYYSMAYKKTRQDFVNEHFGSLVGGMIAFIIVRLLIKHLQNRTQERSIKG